MSPPFHESYNPHAFKRHWSAGCEAYTGGDALFSFIYTGWQVQETIFYQEILFPTGRQTHVYYFFLKKDYQIICMPVISSPNVVNFAHDPQFKLLCVSSWVTRHRQATRGIVKKAKREIRNASVAEAVTRQEERVAVGG